MTPDDPLCGGEPGPTEKVTTLCAEGVCPHDPAHRPLPVLFLGDAFSSVLTRWRLDEKERAAVAAGADLWVWQEGVLAGFYPMLPTFEPPRTGPACPNCRHMPDHTAGEQANRCQFCPCTADWPN